MLEFIIKRLFRAIGTLFILVLMAFFLLEYAPGDPLQKFNGSSGVLKTSTEYLKIKRQLEEQLGLNLPVFYFTVSSQFEPDTLYKIPLEEDKKTLRKLLFEFGDWNQIAHYYKAHNQLLEYNRDIDFDDRTLQLNCHEIITANFYNRTPTAQLYRVKVLYSYYKDKKGVELVENLLQARESIKPKMSWTKYLPKLNIYPNNKFHRWVFGDGKYTNGIIRGDFGLSYVTGEPVEKKIANKLFWSVLLSVLGIVLAYFFGIIASVYSVKQRKQWLDRSITLFSVALFSVPAFWFASILLLGFANPDFFNLFPVSGIQPIGGFSVEISFSSKLISTIPYLVLPTISYGYSAFAVVNQTLKGSLLEEQKNDYFQTALAKGLSRDQAITKHALKNAALPIVTMFSTAFPIAIGGSLIIETIFNIPGMGNEIMQAVYHQDYPVIIAFFVLAGFVTVISYTLADIIYSKMDPRIALSRLA